MTDTTSARRSSRIVSLLIAVAVAVGFTVFAAGGVVAADTPDDTQEDDLLPDEVEIAELCVAGGEDPFGQPQEPVCVGEVVDNVVDYLSDETAASTTAAGVCIGPEEDPMGQPQEPVCIYVEDLTSGTSTATAEPPNEVCVGPEEDPFGQPQEPVCIWINE